MRTISFWLISIVLVIDLSTYCYGLEEYERPRNIILIGWDGAQKNHVKECLNLGELPNLIKLSSEGNLVAIDILRTTDTKAGWAQILTGYEPEVTGVFSNSDFKPIPKGYTVFERLESFFASEIFVSVAVIGKKGNLGISPPKRLDVKKLKKEKYPKRILRQGKKVIEGGAEYLLIPAEPYYYTQEGLDVFINGLMEDRKVGMRVLDLLEKYKDKQFFFFVHFAEIDHKGHKHGENSQEYNNALISADYWTGKIMEKLKVLDLYDRTKIYVTADHGFDEGKKTHRDAPYVFLATNDSKVIRRGERTDIAPTILERFGLDLKDINPPLNGQPLSKPFNQQIW